MTTLTFDVDAPRRLVSANRRIHHMVRAEVCAYWRGIGYVIGREAVPYERAHITVTFRYPDKRRRDVNNLYPYVTKPLVDGLVDAGVLPDDDDAHLVGPDHRRDPEPGPHRITVHIDPACAASPFCGCGTGPLYTGEPA